MTALLTPISRKTKSRIGKHPVLSDIEQDLGDKIFVIINSSHCRWVNKCNDPDFHVEVIE